MIWIFIVRIFSEINGINVTRSGCRHLPNAVNVIRSVYVNVNLSSNSNWLHYLKMFEWSGGEALSVISYFDKYLKSTTYLACSIATLSGIIDWHIQCWILFIVLYECTMNRNRLYLLQNRFYIIPTCPTLILSTIYPVENLMKIISIMLSSA